MIVMQCEAFIGHELQVYENRLRSRGTITECTYGRDGVMTFTTEKGDFSFYYIYPDSNPLKRLTLLKNGDLKIWGDVPRWCYVKAL